MGMPIITEGIVVSKTANDRTKDDGTKVTYYNIKLGNEKYDSQVIGVPQEVYDQVSEGQKIQLGGEFGGLKNKYWKFDRLIAKK